jgi:hypothetical protein
MSHIARPYQVVAEPLYEKLSLEALYRIQDNIPTSGLTVERDMGHSA